jgi:hypothetical protein
MGGEDARTAHGGRERKKKDHSLRRGLGEKQSEKSSMFSAHLRNRWVHSMTHDAVTALALKAAKICQTDGRLRFGTGTSTRRMRPRWFYGSEAIVLPDSICFSIDTNIAFVGIMRRTSVLPG